jgi:hypothetical protein
LGGELGQGEAEGVEGGAISLALLLGGVVADALLQARCQEDGAAGGHADAPLCLAVIDANFKAAIDRLAGGVGHVEDRRERSGDYSPVGGETVSRQPPVT